MREFEKALAAHLRLCLSQEPDCSTTYSSHDAAMWCGVAGVHVHRMGWCTTSEAVPFDLLTEETRHFFKARIDAPELKKPRMLGHVHSQT